ncbi:MarR family winged helix-turn-helix transcriptional regulator [Chelativorans sp. YIM 93263]|uniref:MarR family winged helix-turn-helix transcriptional regulator n=1 Tax=Chelativorans sp. YIM 93263 TaxID=2906648 RepID=UPI002378F6B1|nr:MarR family transcriptional regulator [Chelativorans sp. YIM 93263]
MTVERNPKDPSSKSSESLAVLGVDDLDCLEDLLSFYVRSVNYALSADLDARLENLEVARGTGKITALLLIDSHPGIRPSAIAKATLRDRPSVSRIITHLLQHGLIAKQETPSERRAFALYITDAGHDLAQKVRKIVKTQSDDFFSRIPKEDQEELLRITRNLFTKLLEDRAP